ncbi:diguanylate cyclase [Thermotoga sp. RQ7]|uniref:GGDEF domain-containing protein n=1 Tax=Thermotoga sp. RQ7 TaxID=126738 RepID=UPI0031BA7135
MVSCPLHTSKQQAERVASRIREKIRNSNELGVDVDISYGVAELNPGDNYLKFLQKADEEMYGMKREKKSCCD